MDDKIDVVIHENTADYSKLDTICFTQDGKGCSASDIVSSCHFVPLETNKSGLIGSIAKIIYRHNRIYIHNWIKGNSSIIVFDSKGTFLSNLKRIGKGPGEYVEIMDFCVDEFGCIYVLDAFHSDKLIKYSSKLEYLSTLNIEAGIDRFYLKNDRIYGYSAFSEYKNASKHLLFIFDLKGNVLKKYFPFENVTTSHSSHNNIFTQHNEDVYLNMPFSDIVYSIDSQGNIEARYCLEYFIKDKERRLINRFKKDKYKKFVFTKSNILSITSDPFYLVGISGFGGNGLTYEQGCFILDGRKDYRIASLIGSFVGLVGDSVLISYLEPLTISDNYSQDHTYYDFFNENLDFIKDIQVNNNPILVFSKINMKIPE